MEYLTGQVNDLNTQIKSLEKKIKNSPDDLQAQLKSFLHEAKQEMDSLHKSIKNLEDLTKKTVEYFCEDEKKFKLEACLSELNQFISEFETAVKVCKNM